MYNMYIERMTRPLPDRIIIIRKYNIYILDERNKPNDTYYISTAVTIIGIFDALYMYRRGRRFQFR